MMDYRKALDAAKNNSVCAETMARKVFLSFPTHAFVADQELEFELMDKVARFFKVPFAGVQIVGSAKTGFSLIKDTEFDSTQSDLDIALVDRELFAKYWEVAFKRSSGFQVGTFQLVGEDQRNANERRKRFLQLLQKGIISPDFFPQCVERGELEAHFLTLSQGYRSYFTKISAFIYASETFFEAKQVDAINHYWYK